MTCVAESAFCNSDFSKYPASTRQAPGVKTKPPELYTKHQALT